MKCCILQADGSIEPLQKEDGSAPTHYEMPPLSRKEPGRPVEYVSPAEITYQRFQVVDGVGHDSLPPAGYLYARVEPTAEQLLRALQVLHQMDSG